MTERTEEVQQGEPEVLPGSEEKEKRQVRFLPLPAPRKEIVVPPVAVAERVFHQMNTEVLLHADKETSWGLWGLVYKDGSVLVCGTLIPEDDVIRRYGTTQSGGSTMADQIRWLKAEFKLMQRAGLAHKEASLRFLFKGHSHHTLGMRRYSSVDINSHIDAVTSGLDVAIGPLANIDSMRSFEIRDTKEPGTLQVVSQTRVSFHFYYYSAALQEQGVWSPVLVKPEVFKGPLNFLPTLGWHLTNPLRYQDEISALEEHGCEVEVTWDLVEGEKPRDRIAVTFNVNKEGWSQSVQFRTRSNYPQKPPEIIFPLDPGILPIGLLRIGWSRDSMLVDYVKRLERLRRV